MYKMIIVDDDARTSNHLGNYFPWNENGFEVIDKFYDGHSAYEFLLKNKVDLIVCDIKMPIMNGIELARNLWEQKRKEIIIFISGFKDFDYAQKAIEYGVTSYCLKPVTYTEIKSKLEIVKEKLENSSREIDISNDEANNLCDKKILKIKNYIKANYKDVTLNTIADFMGMNQSYLSRMFKLNTNENISNYITKTRMKNALLLLRDDKYKHIYEIAELVGYINPVSFTKSFSKIYGVTPATYRKNFSVTEFEN